MVTEGCPKSKYWPVRVRLYPPNTSPVVLDKDSTTGVWSYLNSTALVYVNLLKPSS